MASTAVPTVGSIPWHPPAAQPRPVSPPGTRQASCLAPPGLKEQHRSAQNRERRKHSLFLPLPPSRAGGQCRLPGQGSRLPPCPALRRGRETEARPLPTLRAGRGGGRTRCPGSRPQPRHCHGSPAGSWCRGAPCPAGRAGAAGANRLFALPAFPPPAWSRRPRSIPTPRGGTVPPDAGPRFPEGPPVAMCRAPPSCPTLAWAGGDRFPPRLVSHRTGRAQSRGAGGGAERYPGALPRQCPWSPPGPEGTTSAPEAPKPQLGEVERPQTSSDGEFPACSAPGEGLTEGTASPAAEMARGGGDRDRLETPPGPVAAWGHGGTGLLGERGWGWRMPAHGGLGAGARVSPEGVVTASSSR